MEMTMRRRAHPKESRPRQGIKNPDRRVWIFGNEIRYLNPPTVEVRKKKYCRFKKAGIKYVDYKDPEGERVIALESW